MYLPTELWSRIISNVPLIETRMKLRTVCAQWRLAVDSVATWMCTAYINVIITSDGYLKYQLMHNSGVMSSFSIKHRQGASRNAQLLDYLLHRVSPYVDTIRLTFRLTNLFPTQLYEQLWNRLLSIRVWRFSSVVTEIACVGATTAHHPTLGSAMLLLEQFLQLRRQIGDKTTLRSIHLDVMFA
jgi:hypothetical protein